jgi:hypothetical protein
MEELGLYYTDIPESEYDQVLNQYRYYLTNYEDITNQQSFYDIDRMMYENFDAVMSIMEERFDIDASELTSQLSIYIPTNDELNILNVFEQDVPEVAVVGDIVYSSNQIDLSNLQFTIIGDTIMNATEYRCIIGIQNDTKFYPLQETYGTSIEQSLSCTGFNAILIEDLVAYTNGDYHLGFSVLTTDDEPLNIVPVTNIPQNNQEDEMYTANVLGFNVSYFVWYDDENATLTIQKIDQSAPYIQLLSGYISFDEDTLTYTITDTQYETLGELIDDFLLSDNLDHVINLTLADIERSDGTVNVDRATLFDSDYSYTITVTDSTGNSNIFTIHPIGE